MEKSSTVIGKKVKKKSGKPFKSGNLVNTITGIIINPRSPKNEKAYTFEEDSSCVNICLCEII